MKKCLLVVLVVIVFIITGCSKREILKCKTDTESHIFTIEKGKIIKWVINDKEQSEDIINVMNKDNLNRITDNSRSIDIIKSYIKSFYGVCK